MRASAFLRWLLIPLAALYSLLTGFRNWLYNRGILRIHTFSIPVISVGNITAGGTGKTPMTAYLAQKILDKNLTPGIVSRGYKRQGNELLVVHDGENIQADSLSAGDEPYMLAVGLVKVPVIVDRNRVRGIQEMIGRFKVDAVILDDGFQHRRAGRDFDLVLINSREPASAYKQLPLGFLRESLKNIRRADAVLYTNTDGSGFPEIHATLQQYHHEPYLCSAVITQIVKMGSASSNTTAADSSQLDDCFAFCGIANPKAFFADCVNHGISLSGQKTYRDHQDYGPEIIRELTNLIDKSKAKCFITTEKDYVKLPEDFKLKFDNYCLKLEITLDQNSKEIINRQLNRLLKLNTE